MWSGLFSVCLVVVDAVFELFVSVVLLYSVIVLGFDCVWFGFGLFGLVADFMLFVFWVLFCGCLAVVVIVVGCCDLLLC